MGAAESSSLSSNSQVVDEITTASERSKEVDTVLEKLKSHKITAPILASLPTESSFTDLESLRQFLLREIENKIKVADALAVKLLQRFNYSVSAMKTTSHHLSDVHSLQVDLGELKGRLMEVISNRDALCKIILSEGPQSLRSSIKPFTVPTSDPVNCKLS